MVTIQELNDRLSIIQRELGDAQDSLGVALLNGEPADGHRDTLDRIESAIRDLQCQAKALPQMTVATQASHDTRRRQLEAAKKSARAEMNTALDDFKAKAGKMGRAERKAECARIKAIARKARRVNEVRDVLADLAVRIGDDALLNF